MYQLDEVDKKIIEALKKDARTPFTKIGSMLGVSDATIHVRLNKLKAEGVLLGYTVELNEELLGKKIHGIARIKVKLHHLEEVVSKLVANNRISKVYETQGDCDLIIFFDVNNMDKLRQLIREIRKIENISAISSKIILKIWK